MKNLLLILSLFAGSASAMTYEEYKAMPDDQICTNLPTYIDVRSWSDNTKISDKEEFSSKLLHVISKKCIAQLKLVIEEQKSELIRRGIK